VIPGETSGAGALGADGIAWLDATLAEEPEAPTIIAMHHPPVEIGMQSLDAIRLDPADAAAFTEIVARSPQVVRVVCGHVHRTMFAMVGNVPIVACPSVHLQCRLELEGGPLRSVPEPPAFVLHLWRDGVLRSHVQPIV
jgi:3',5'-cyclic AMP phosphodiesterase CpdA